MKNLRRIFFLAIAIFAIFKIYEYYKPDATSKIVDEIRSNTETVSNDTVVNTEHSVETKSSDEKTPVDSQKEAAPFTSELINSAKEINEDAIAWIEVPGTGVDYPVLQAEDNEYYLYRNILGEYDRDGSIYLDQNTSLHDKNIIVYGHNMQNGNMFSTLTKYLEESFIQKNSIIRLETMEGIRQYEIVAIASVDYTDGRQPLLFSEHTNDLVNYYDALSPYIIWEAEKSMSADNKYISLVTCTFETEDTRTVIIGREY